MKKSSTSISNPMGRGGKQQKTKASVVMKFIMLIPIVAMTILIAILAMANIQPSHNDGTETTTNNNVIPPKVKKEQKSTSSSSSAAAAVVANSINNNNNNNNPEYYMIFSTGCSEFQDWQSYAFFYFAMKVKQRGQVIRIASGCNEKQSKTLTKIFKEQISIMSPNFHLHLTPDFSGPDHYKYYNKPFGVKHFMENYLGYKPNEKSNKHDNAIIMLLDPDQILLRPMGHDFSEQNVVYHIKKKRGSKAEPVKPLATKVQHGVPFASVYGFGNQPFHKVNIETVTGDKNSPALKTDPYEQQHNYPAGPPYMATGKDMYAISLKWTEYVPRVHKEYKHLLGEMYAYCLAAAHLKLKHQLMDSFMISDVNVGDEGWPLIDPILEEKDQICSYPPPSEKMPSVIHFCQNYWLGKWFIGKYRLDKDFLTCEHTLIKVPPSNVAEQYDFAIRPGSNPYGERTKLNPTQVKRNAFFLCYLIPAFNEVAKWYKDHHCKKEGDKPNYEESHVFHYSMDPNDNSAGEKVPHHW